MRAVAMLVDGKTDTELLEALALALTTDDDSLLNKLRDGKYGAAAISNVEVAGTIVHIILARIESRQAE